MYSVLSTALLIKAKKTCSEEVLDHEINNIKEDLCNNSYPISSNNRYCKEQDSTSQEHSEDASLITMHKTQRMLRSSAKDTEPFLDTSRRIYEFTCICGSKYIGRIEQYLPKCIKEYLPKWLIQSEEKVKFNNRPQLELHNGDREIRKKDVKLKHVFEGCLIKIETKAIGNTIKYIYIHTHTLQNK